MRVFDEPNLSENWKCPICKTADNKPIVLVGINGTQEGHTMQAEQVHVDCLDLLIYKRDGDTIIAQYIKEEE